MDCPNCQNDNLTDYPLCPTCSTTRHFTNRTDCRCEPCRWMDYREAAEMMRRPADYFRIKNADGSYKHFPSIERWQPGGKGTRLYVRRDDVMAWIVSSRTPVQIKQKFTGIGYESARPTLERLGAYGTMKSLGLK